jgi:hypothetical protein
LPGSPYRKVPYSEQVTWMVRARCLKCDQSWTGDSARWKSRNHARQRGPEHVVVGTRVQTWRVWRPPRGEMPVKSQRWADDDE